jgi:pilus assembly protein CpaB
MKSKTMILMAVAVVCGLGASYMTSRILAERNEKAPEEEKVTVLVAKKNIPQGQFIKVPEEWFAEKEYSISDAPKKAARSFDEVKDRVVSKPLSAEQWVVSDDLLTKVQSGLGYALPKGMRAETIRVNVDTVVAGFVQANSRVDILNTVRKDDRDSYCQTILQNMLVLAIDQIDTKDQEKKAIVSSTVTLAVTPEEAQELALAQQLGELRLVLRPPDDNEIAKIKPVKPDDIRNAKKQGKPGSPEEGGEGTGLGAKVPDVPSIPPMGSEAPPVEPVKKKKPHRLVVLNGDSQTTAIFLDEDNDEIQTQIIKSDAEPKPVKSPATAPEKAGSEPEKAAASPEKEKTPPSPPPGADSGKPAPRQRAKSGG